MRHVAETTGRDLEALYDNIAWPLYKVGPGACVERDFGAMSRVDSCVGTRRGVWVSGYVALGCAGAGPCGVVAMGAGKALIRLMSVREHATSGPFSVLAEPGKEGQGCLRFRLRFQFLLPLHHFTQPGSTQPLPLHPPSNSIASLKVKKTSSPFHRSLAVPRPRVRRVQDDGHGRGGGGVQAAGGGEGQRSRGAAVARGGSARDAWPTRLGNAGGMVRRHMGGGRVREHPRTGDEIRAVGVGVAVRWDEGLWVGISRTSAVELMSPAVRL